jgi:hypothetical protein
MLPKGHNRDPAASRLSMRSAACAESRHDRCLSTKGALAQAVEESKRFTDRIEEAIQQAEAHHGAGGKGGSPDAAGRVRPVTGGHGGTTNPEDDAADPEGSPPKTVNGRRLARKGKP